MNTITEFGIVFTFALSGYAVGGFTGAFTAACLAATTVVTW